MSNEGETLLTKVLELRLRAPNAIIIFLCSQEKVQKIKLEKYACFCDGHFPEAARYLLTVGCFSVSDVSYNYDRPWVAMIDTVLMNEMIVSQHSSFPSTKKAFPLNCFHFQARLIQVEKRIFNNSRVLNFLTCEIIKICVTNKLQVELERD